MKNEWNPNLFMSREQMHQYDDLAINQYGIAGAVLMETAGVCVARAAMKMLDGNQVAIICGPGNNGGDGFVVARHLINAGCRVNTFVAVATDKLKGDAQRNYNTLVKMNAQLTPVLNDAALKSLGSALKKSDLIIDAVLGTGVTRNLDGLLADVITQINQADVPVLCVDIPSGLDANTGIPWGPTVDGDATITFGHIKTGLLMYPGAEHTGELSVVPIGVPAEASEEAGTEGALLSREHLQNYYPFRTSDAHKGSQGHLAVVAGSLGKSGAAVMAARAAMRTGAGLVTIGTTENARHIIEQRLLEVMVQPIIDKPDAALMEKDLKTLNNLMEGKTALAIGPGLTTAPGISALTIRLLTNLEVPAVVDADGLNILAADPSAARRINAPMVFTPHPGEMARLTNKSKAQIQTNRLEISKEAAKWHNAVIVLKGAHSVIASPDGKLFVNPTGNAGMASAGMGDVLAGIIGGFLAQDVPPLEAALLGTYIHGETADSASETTGLSGLVAGDVIELLPSILKNWERH